MLPKAKKSFGQNFLRDPAILKAIITASDIQEGEVVLEIGPGTGTLTQALVDAGAKVVAIELDKDLINDLESKFQNNITLVQGDILKHNISDLVHGSYKVVANIPYNITSPIIEKFLTESIRPDRMVFMVQREVADRIIAKPPNMSVLAVVCQIYAACKKVKNVPRKAFSPAPKVDSAVIQMDVFKDQEINPEEIIRLARIGFSSKRKQLQKNLATALPLDGAEIKKILTSIGLDEKVRAEALEIKDWVQFFKQL